MYYSGHVCNFSLHTPTATARDQTGSSSQSAWEANGEGDAENEEDRSKAGFEQGRHSWCLLDTGWWETDSNSNRSSWAQSFKEEQTQSLQKTKNGTQVTGWTELNWVNSFLLPLNHLLDQSGSCNSAAVKSNVQLLVLKIVHIMFKCLLSLFELSNISPPFLWNIVAIANNIFPIFKKNKTKYMLQVFNMFIVKATTVVFYVMGIKR